MIPHLRGVARASMGHSQVVLGPQDVEHLLGVAACLRADPEARLAEDSLLGVVRSDARGHQVQLAWAVAGPRVLVWGQGAVVPLG